MWYSFLCLCKAIKKKKKSEVELEEETTRKFSKSCDEARIPETKAMTFNQCTFIISKD